MSTPFSAKQFTFTQPDGTALWVKGWGNQYYAVFECLNGYTIVKDPVTGYWVYADVNPDGETLLPTGVRPRLPNTKADDLGIAQGLRVKPEAAKAQAMQSPMLASKSRWEQRRENARVMAAYETFGDPRAAAAPPSRHTTGDFTGLCLLIQFPDQPAGTISQQEVDDFCNKPGYTGFNNNGSVYDYFYDVSGGKIRYKNIVTPYYTARHPRSYYANTAYESGVMARELIKEALDHLKKQGFDFTRLTSDTANYVYAINALYAGWCPNSWAQGLWPHQGHQLLPYELTPGKLAYDYQITDMTDSLSLAVFCHENGHMICEFPDMYDYGFDSSGLGTYCTMCSYSNMKNPAHVNPYLKYKAGWVQATELTLGMTATARAGSNQVYIHRNPANSREYFIIENREQTGRDEWIPGSGLAIWHVDEWGSQQNQQMSSDYHYECSLVQADGRYDLEYTKDNYGDATDLFWAGGTDQIGANTSPHTRWWDGSESGLEIYDISAAGLEMTFKTKEQGSSIPVDIEPLFTLKTQGAMNLRDGHHVLATIVQTLQGTHTLTGPALWTATERHAARKQLVGDQWLYVTAVDGNPVTCFVAVIHNGVVYNTFTTRRTHRVMAGELLSTIARAYGTSVAKIVEVNAHKYNKPGHRITADWIEEGWVLNIPD